MRQHVLAALILTVPVILLGCGAGAVTHDSCMQETIAIMNEMSTALSGIKDAAGAKAAEGKLNGFKQRMDDVEKKMKALPKLSAEDEKKLKEKYAKPLGEATGKMMGEVFRIAMIQGAGDMMKGFGK